LRAIKILEILMITSAEARELEMLEINRLADLPQAKEWMQAASGEVKKAATSGAGNLVVKAGGNSLCDQFAKLNANNQRAIRTRLANKGYTFSFDGAMITIAW
jgi:hypothetical protein